MTYTQVLQAQRDNGFDGIQKLIDSGEVWKMEGSMGRYAMDCLKSGACFLPKKPSRDYYGSRIPSRDEVEEGSTGSFKNSVNFYTYSLFTI